MKLCKHNENVDIHLFFMNYPDNQASLITVTLALRALRKEIQLFKMKIYPLA